MNQLRAGEVQVVDNVPLDKVDELEGIPGVQVSRTMGNSYAHLALNLREVPAFRDLRVRQAVAHAVDRRAIAEDVLEGVVTVVDSVIQPMSWAFNAGVEFYDYDPDRARELLREAGYEDRDADGIVEKDGIPLAFPGTTRSGHAEWEMVLQVLQAQLKSVGIGMEIRNYEPTMLGSSGSEASFRSSSRPGRSPPTRRSLSFTPRTARLPGGATSIITRTRS